MQPPDARIKRASRLPASATDRQSARPATLIIKTSTERPPAAAWLLRNGDACESTGARAQAISSSGRGNWQRGAAIARLEKRRIKYLRNARDALAEIQRSMVDSWARAWWPSRP